MASALQAGLGIVAFFGFGLILAWALKAGGAAMLAVVIVALLAVALVLQAITESPWLAFAALALAVLAALGRFAVDAVIWAEGRGRHRR